MSNLNYPTEPVLKDLFHRKASVSLKFVVVGGSIGGLAAAYNLIQAGHEVLVLEASSGKDFTTRSSGTRVPPNLTRLLLHWGLKDEVDRVSIKCPKVDFCQGRSGDYLGGLTYHEQIMKELQAHAVNMLFSDLYRMIHDIAVQSGARIRYNAKVVDLDVTTPHVVLESGERISGDIIIGADGGSSFVREKLFGKDDFQVGPLSGYNFLIPAESMRRDPELKPYTMDGTWTTWVHSGRGAVCNMASKDYYYAILLQKKEGDIGTGWTKHVSPSEFDFSDFDPRFIRLMSMAVDVIEQRHTLHEPLEDWFDDDGHVLLMGDAVHEMLPGGSHGASLAVEDAAVLGSLFSRLRTRDSGEIMRLMSAYQEIRQNRCEEIVRDEGERGTWVSFEDGSPEQIMRDDNFRASKANEEKFKLGWGDIEEEYLRAAWESFKGPFGYDAYDAADDWWIDWGLLQARMSAFSDPNAGSFLDPSTTMLMEGLTRTKVESVC